MRPSHPVTAPIPLKTDAKTSSAKSKDKQPATSPSKSQPTDETKKRKKDASKKSKRTLKRARVLTIDPTRYSRSHLSGPFLEQAADGEDRDVHLPEGSHWECEELDDEESSEESDANDEVIGKGKQRKQGARSDQVRWVPRDKDNNIVRTEVVPRRRSPDRSNPGIGKKAEGASKSHTKEAPKAADLRPSSPAMSTDSSSSDEEDTSEDEDGYEEEADQGHDEDTEAASKHTGVNLDGKANAPAASKAAWKLEAYDPDAESDFSEGYDEAEATKQATSATASSANFATERNGTMDLLSKMFGDDVKNAASVLADASGRPHAEGSDEDEEDEDWWKTLKNAAKGAKATASEDETALAEKSGQRESQKEQEGASIAASRDRRAALLAAANASVGQEDRASTAAYQPVARFVPPQPEETQTITEDHVMGEQSQAEDLSNEDAAESVSASPEGPVSVENPQAPPKRDNMIGMQYQLESLKDMFKPQEAETGGFSLMAGLDIELDEEINFDLDAEQEAQKDAMQEDATESEPAPQRSTMTDETAKIVPHPFPLFDPSNPRDPIQLLQKGLYIPFCRTDTEEEIVARWEERKGRLTQEYKRRHREAVKKKKRRVTGSRAAGSAGGAVRGAHATDD